MLKRYSWQLLQNHIAEWSDMQFGNNRNPDCMISHLKKEVEELSLKPYSSEEYADCLMLLLDAARVANIDTEQLWEATVKKLEINKKRKWGKPDEDGVVEHIDEDGNELDKKHR